MGTIVVRGKSNTEYHFSIYAIDYEFDEAGGVYIFANIYNYGDKYFHDLIYCGKTKDLSTRFSDHHKADDIERHDANCICVMEVSTEEERTSIEQDILEGNEFPCNDQHNS
jgi:hypothetical protein